MDDLAHFAWRHIAHRVIDDARFDVQCRLADGARLGQGILRLEGRGQWRHLSLSVHIPEANVGQTLVELLEDLERHDARAVVRLAQRRQIDSIKHG